jgi:hypothetical protein
MYADVNTEPINGLSSKQVKEKQEKFGLNV